jgi:hypothetical protein
MIVGPPLYKQAGEIKDWIVDFSDALESHTVATKTFSATKESDGTNATTDLKQGAEVEASGVVSQAIKAGVHGLSYMLQLRVTDSVGLIYEAEQRLIVQDVL